MISKPQARIEYLALCHNRGFDTALRGWPARAPLQLGSLTPEWNAWHSGHAAGLASMRRDRKFENFSALAYRFQAAAEAALSQPKTESQ